MTGVHAVSGSSLPLWFRAAYLVFVVVMVPAYALTYPLINFLWFSNIALLTGLVAAWWGSARLASMMLVAVGLLEIGWILDFLGGLVLGGTPPLGVVAYLFDPQIPWMVRALSLYHLPLPVVLFWMVWRLGYDARAWRLLLPLGWMVVVAVHLLADPDQNVNFALYPPWQEPGNEPSGWWLAVLLPALAVAWWLTHRVVLWGLRVLDSMRGSAEPR